MAKPASPQNTNNRDLDPLVKDSSTFAVKRAVVTRAVAGIDYVAGDVGVATHSDDAAMATGDPVVAMAGLADDTSTDAVDEGDIGVVRMTLNRELRTTSATGAPTDRSGAITTGGTAQNAAAALATRKYFIIQNISAEDLWFRFDGSAATADKPAIKLTTGQSWENPAHWCPTAAISVIAATTGSKFTAWEA